MECRPVARVARQVRALQYDELQQRESNRKATPERDRIDAIGLSWSASGSRPGNQCPML